MHGTSAVTVIMAAPSISATFAFPPYRCTAARIASPDTTTPRLVSRTNAGSEPITKRMSKNFANGIRSEEHTSELQSLRHLVCRLLLEKKKKYNKISKDEVGQ